MKNALIITAHPYVQSFNFALRSEMLSTLKSLGWHSDMSDLYQQAFNPLLGTDDFTEFDPEIGFNLGQQQVQATKSESYHPEIIAEQEKLRQADIVILQFPLWWGSYPAILKGWIERVISRGFAYGDNFELSNKKVMLSVTTGGASNKEEEEYYADKVASLAADIFEYTKMEIQPAFICHGPTFLNPHQRAQSLQTISKHLDEVLIGCTIS